MTILPSFVQIIRAKQGAVVISCTKNVKGDLNLCDILNIDAQSILKNHLLPQFTESKCFKFDRVSVFGLGIDLSEVSTPTVEVRMFDTTDSLKAQFKSTSPKFQFNDIVLVCVCRELSKEETQSVEVI